mgnify:CR=1 FL=1
MNKKHEKVIAPDVGWRNVTRAGIIPTAGDAEYYETGGWRTKKPVWIEDKCIHCLLCWRFCPDSSVIAEDGKFGRFDYEHCKGCGICVNVCPSDAIDFIDEGETSEGRNDGE